MVTPGESIILAGRDWLWPVAIILAIGTILVSWSYLRSNAPRGLRVVCAGLKLLGITALLLCLLEPMRTGERPKPGANLIAIVADNSLSLKLRGRGESETRGELLQRALSRDRSAWRTELAKNFEVRNYLADSSLQATQEFEGLNFEGQTSALGGSLLRVAERHRAQPLAGILLLSDGIPSDFDGLDASSLPPIYPVIFGGDQPPRDLSLASVAVSQTAFEDAPVTVQPEVSLIGFAGEEVTGKLLAFEPGQTADQAKVVAEQTLKVPAGKEKMQFRFQVRPEKSGVIFYRLRVAAKGEWDQGTNATTEATMANNETVVTVNRTGGPYRVLYVSGRPNWEYKFLRRAIEADDQTELVGLIRIAKREPKFEFRGRAGESSNPMFRGFGQQPAEGTERYDQPVLVRLNTRDEFELREGFPKVAEDLFGYDAVIIDDLEAEFFKAEQMTLLQRFVSERGGGFLMLGGAESFVQGTFGRTPIGDMLPVYVDKGPAPVAERPPLRLSLTREGWLQPWARLRPNEAEERTRLEETPALEVLNQTREPKPAATVVATVTDGQTEYPALVTQRFGRGRTGALLVGDFWQAGLGSEALQTDLGKAWRQMIRWLVADLPERVELRAEPQSGGEKVQLQVRVRDAKFQPLDNATVTLKVVRAGAAADAPPLLLTAEASLKEPGLYETTYVARESDGYRAEATVVDEAGTPAGGASSGWTTDLPAAEYRDLKPNRAAMEQLARQTKGKVLAPADLEAFVRDLPSIAAPVKEIWTRPLWHTPWMLLAALSCLVLEWGLRRWKGLA
jgi:uncharacterized membrane protein